MVENGRQGKTTEGWVSNCELCVAKGTRLCVCHRAQVSVVVVVGSKGVDDRPQGTEVNHPGCCQPPITDGSALLHGALARDSTTVPPTRGMCRRSGGMQAHSCECLALDPITLSSTIRPDSCHHPAQPTRSRDVHGTH
jgi:hypothetical protein